MAERDERSEAPTSKRRGEARKEGNIPKSTEINSVLVLLAGIILIRLFAPMIYGETRGLFRDIYGNIGNPVIDQTIFATLFLKAIISMLKMLMPIALGILLVGIIANVMQVGFLVTTKPLMPKLSKINPISGFKRLFSMRSVVDTVKNILKLTIVAWVAYVTVRAELKHMLFLADSTVAAILLFILGISFKVILRIVLVLIILAILDFAYQRYEHEKNLKMTKQEIKDERKSIEGDPKIKGRIRRMQIEMARRRMMGEVPKATVVITNPTYIAIAIKYESAEMDTPVIVAKGKRLIAEKIKQIASGAGIPIVEDKPLARAMYDKVEPGDKIPVDFFTAVAEIMAYVYRLRKKAA